MTVAVVLGKKHRFQQYRQHNHRNKWFSCTDLLILLELSLATVEQMRLAQVIFDKNDSDFEAKVKQLMEVTGKNQDECIVALHDCNGDINKAINILLEGNSDTTSWETVGGKKKNFGKESSENKENREKRSEREANQANRGRGNNNRKGKGSNRGREFRGEENGIDCNQGDKTSDRGKRARVRGFGRGRGRGTGWFSAQSMGTFNPADYSDSTSTDGCGTKVVVWETAQNGANEGLELATHAHNITQNLPNKSSYELKGAWKNSVEEWTTDDWTEDLSETKVFTASSVAAENDVIPRQSIDLVSLLRKPVPPGQVSEVGSFETSQQQSFGQALVFTNSQHNSPMAPGPVSSSAATCSPQHLEVMSSISLYLLLFILFSDPLRNSLPMTSAVQGSTCTASAIATSSLSSSSLSSTSPVTTSSSYDQSAVHSRIAYQSSVIPPGSAPGAIPNGHGGGRSQQTLDTTSSVPAPKTTDPPSTLASVSSLSSTTSCTALLPSVSQHTAALPSLSQPGDLSSSPLSQLSSSLASHPSSLSSAQAAVSSTPHTHANEENPPPIQSSTTFSTSAPSCSSAPSSSVSPPGSMSTGSSLCLGGTTVSTPSSTGRAVPLVTSGKVPPNLPQGLPPLLHNQYLVGPGGLLPAYPIYGYDELQMLQSRLPMDYYGIPFAAPTALASRDGSLANNPYSGDVTKFGRGDSGSPAPPTTLAQPQQSQSQTHHTAQQPFLNPALPPGYSYTGLPYYTGVPSAFQYGPTMFVPPASAKQHGVNLSTPATPFQQASGYGQQSYSTGYDDLTQGTAAGDYTKGGYAGSSQTPNKSAGSGPGKGASVPSGVTGLPDMTASVYKTQAFDKQGFHAGTPPPFSLPSALGSTGPLAPAAAPGYAPAPFLHILPAHQQPHSQLLHHHLPQDAQSGSGQRSQPSSLQPKSQASKPTYGNSPYWTN
ncbi:ubiquitin-associated protein 2 [Octodon degus]|uniref:Ubiquitin-associated protein 2 n=1 Tax=Octodon degus TaxID=10160 RepID=A0A6P6EIL2_OCTDE|nr:ubiquitin-associated protein 2 [Octodon degus]